MDYDYKSYSSKKFYIGKGLSNLKNLGNTCYLNSTLSVMANCLGLTHYFVSNAFTSSLNPVNMEKPEHVFLKQYISVLVGLYSKNQTIAPVTLNNNLSKFLPELKKDYQHDAYGCMVGILDLLHNALMKPINNETAGPVDTRIHRHLLDSRNVYYDHFKDGYSIVNDLFFGQYIQKVKCTKCNHLSYSYQPFMGINLPLIKIKDELPTIYDMLNSYFRKQTINKICADKCKINTEHVMKTRIIRLPKYLIIHFKRFNNNLQKIHSTVPFSSDLEMSSYTAMVQSQSVEYNLVNVINHAGDSINSGHYHNFNRTFDGKWVSINDHTTKPISATSVCTNQAYILIYELNEF